jgi:hypothetical protein
VPSPGAFLFGRQRLSQQADDLYREGSVLGRGALTDAVIEIRRNVLNV